MKTQVRPYNRENDFERVYAFLDRTFISDGCYPNWSPQRWEYMHFHPNLNSKELHKIGIWEDNNQIIALPTMKTQIRDVYLSLDPNFPHLKSDMIDYAERHFIQNAGQ